MNLPIPSWCPQGKEHAYRYLVIWRGYSMAEAKAMLLGARA